MPRRGDDFPPLSGGGPQFAFPRLTPAVKVMIIGFVGLFIVQMIEQQWMDRGIMARYLALFPTLIWQKIPQLWRLFTWPLVQAADVSGLLWACVGLYFFGTELEESFGTRRFLLFTAIAVLLTGIVATAYGAVHSTFMAQPVYGVAPLGFALTTAWGIRFPHKRLMFPPVSARVFVWVILGIAVLSIIARSNRESPAASIGAIGVGYLLGKTWDRVDDFLDRRRVTKLRAKRGALKAIQGGKLDDRAKPVDKRFLN